MRRPRPIPRPQVPPGPLRDLKDLLYELYLQAGAPSLDEITALIAADDDLAGAPGRDTVRRIVGEPVPPPAQADVVAVATVLARSGGWAPEDAVQRVRELWVKSRMDVPAGTPVGELTDPFALEVHRPIVIESAAGAPELPVLPLTWPASTTGGSRRSRPGWWTGRARSCRWWAGRRPARPGRAGRPSKGCRPDGGCGTRSSRTGRRPSCPSWSGSGRAPWCG
ncbi:hypothetical protein [Actinomadura madurae]|uniref:hypothetical protein n=1 Tax=Actinomadura madurae TaxID=1993 RepID=UPI0020D23DE2|nr:hypothetical protein [Actinomadura madurae]MCP9951086.1 hypothetical protein [Actinomadura madurae]MCP9980322.1 hypothetical protein [Actinomadura madurae]